MATTPTAETRTIRGLTVAIGDIFFNSADFRATLIDGDDEAVIVRDVFDGDEDDLLYFEWQSNRVHYSEETDGRPKRGCWVLVH